MSSDLVFVFNLFPMADKCTPLYSLARIWENHHLYSWQTLKDPSGQNRWNLITECFINSAVYDICASDLTISFFGKTCHRPRFHLSGGHNGIDFIYIFSLCSDFDRSVKEQKRICTAKTKEGLLTFCCFLRGQYSERHERLNKNGRIMGIKKLVVRVK